jgi:osmotically-inducible protein OsmY
MVDQDSSQQANAVAGAQSEELCETLTDHPDLDTTGIDVTVEEGEVTLSGTVNDRDARWLAEDLAETIPAVQAVHNRLRVAHE